jgi:hypothetical protein
MRWVVPKGAYDIWVAPDAASGIAGMFQVE